MPSKRAQQNVATNVPPPKAPPKPSGSPPGAAVMTSQNPITILTAIYGRYLVDTPQRTKIIDAFLGFLVVTGMVQFAYCVVAGNYPFNAFLAGFCATVGQFVLTVSLRIQSNPQNKAEFAAVSPERAFADFVFGSVLLHFFCINFIN